MQTITFYSYKGGVGRSLAVANVAKYLARFGQKVFAADFDFEAPGLHYKFGLQGPSDPVGIKRGLVDYIHAFAVGDGVPDQFSHYVVEIEQYAESGGSIVLLPAGATPSAEYWRKLSQINWHDCFYAEGAQGIPFFLELKEEIEGVFSPDFLLLDSPSGITEIGGIATTLLADKVVCLLLRNRENLEGAREVLRSILRTPRLPGQSPVEVIPVLARIPDPAGQAGEEGIIEEVKCFLTEEGDDLSSTLELSEILVLHSEPELQVDETLRVGGDRSPDESPLLKDYIRLFEQLFPKDLV